MSSKPNEIEWGNGLKAYVAQVAMLRPNPWNPNRMNDETFQKEVLSIKTNGFVEPIKVRRMADGTLEIVDGEHRWKACQHLGIAEVPVVDLGVISDAQAKKLTIIANELRGAPEPVLLAALIKDLSSDITLADLAIELPMSETELDSLIKSTTAFDWDAVEQALPSTVVRDSTRPQNLGGERRFQLNLTKGNIPTALSNALEAEFNRSANALGTNNVELVLQHWLLRLQATAAQADTDATALADTRPAAPQPTPKVRKPRAAKAVQP